MDVLWDEVAAWVWLPADVPPSRIARARFRRELQLASAPSSATITLSARTRYRLTVNGEIVNSGPCRSYPEDREADRYDVRPWLTCGGNVIEVEVLHLAAVTYHHAAEAPGFIAWGEVVEADGARHGLTTPGAWHCRLRAGVDASAPLLSFAQEPAEMVDLRIEVAGESGDWRVPAVIAPAGATPLCARTLPPLTRLPLSPVEIRRATVSPLERMATAWVAGDGVAGAARGWLYSPCDQSVQLAAWWGDCWINGVQVAKGDDPAVPLRQVLRTSLRAGWNRVFALGEIIFGYWEFCLGWPEEMGLSLHAVPRDGAAPGVELAGPLTHAAVEEVRRAFVANEAANGLAWREAFLDDGNGSPLRALAWAMPGETEPVRGLSTTFPPGSHALVTADMGQIVLGSVAIDIEGPAGTVVCIGHAEQSLTTGRLDYGKALTMYPADRFVLSGGRVRIETFQPRGFRFLEALVGRHSAPVTLHAIGAVEMRYPYAFSGSFECSDSDLNRLWQYGRRTLELCSEDVLTDCPWRERTLYGGDLLAEMGVTVALTRDLRLVRRSLDLFLSSFNPATGWLASRAPGRGLSDLSDYPLLIATGVGWLLRLTDDLPLARRAWPVFQEMARALERMRGADGIYTPPCPAFIDHGRSVVSGPTVAFNAVCIAALRAFALTAQQAGNAAAARDLDVRAAALEHIVPQAYLDPVDMIFRDLPLRHGDGGTEGSPAVVWPLLFAPATRRHAAMVLPALRKILEGFTPLRQAQSVSPYQMFYLLALLRELGEAELAETTIRRVYAEMLANPTGTLWENALPNQSLTHAWSGGVNYYLATAVLGVGLGWENAEEMRVVRVSPGAAGIQWARGCVPHPLGDVTVDWKREDDRLRVTVSAPPDVPVEIAPGPSLAALACEATILRADCTQTKVREVPMEPW